MELHWLLFVVFTSGGNVSSHQVGQTPFLTKSDCMEVAAQSVLSNPRVQAVTWCGPVRVAEGALPSAAPPPPEGALPSVPPTEAPKRPSRRRR
jgi:hypothetical protein